MTVLEQDGAVRAGRTDAVFRALCLGILGSRKRIRCRRLTAEDLGALRRSRKRDEPVDPCHALFQSREHLLYVIQ